MRQSCTNRHDAKLPLSHCCIKMQQCDNLKLSCTYVPRSLRTHRTESLA